MNGVKNISYRYAISIYDVRQDLVSFIHELIVHVTHAGIMGDSLAMFL